MAKQNINVGASASDGTGDDLRIAFTKINENFNELYSGNVQITSANIRIYSVAGREGNVVLTVNDIAQAASKSYVNAAIASNIATIASQPFTASTPSDWDGSVLTIQDALDQLAARLRALGG
jgi:hypothetical protein